MIAEIKRIVMPYKSIAIKIDKNELHILMVYLNESLETSSIETIEERTIASVFNTLKTKLERKWITKRDTADSKQFKLKLDYYQWYYLQNMLKILTAKLHENHFDRAFVIPLYIKLNKTIQ